MKKCNYCENEAEYYLINGKGKVCMDVKACKSHRHNLINFVDNAKRANYSIKEMKFEKKKDYEKLYKEQLSINEHIRAIYKRDLKRALVEEENELG